MNYAARNIEIPEVIGTQAELGVYFGRIRVAESLYALFQPPTAIAAGAPAIWNEDRKSVDDAFSFSDGHANTVAMAKAGSKLAQWALDNGMYIPSLDESDLQYRTFKPGTKLNDCWMRSGINLSAETPLQPYTPDFPKQTALEAYRASGSEAFPEGWLWTSTQSRAYGAYAWAQHFGGGDQFIFHKDFELPVRVVRREIIR